MKDNEIMAVVTQPRAAGLDKAPPTPTASVASIELYWLPLGAGGWFVRLNGRVYEAIHAFLERRGPLDLYHSVLQVRLPEGRVVIENCWPIPDADPDARGVMVQGPVGSRRLVARLAADPAAIPATARCSASSAWCWRRCPCSSHARPEQRPGRRRALSGTSSLA